MLSKRWIVERTFGWLGRCRPLAMGFENPARSHLAFVQVAMIRLMMRRIAWLRAVLIKWRDRLLGPRGLDTLTVLTER